MFFERVASLFEMDILKYLAGGLVVTLEVAVYSVVLSLIFGTILAVGRISPISGIRWCVRLFVELIRSLPTFLVVVFVYFSIYRLGFQVSPVVAVIVGLTIYHGAKIVEIIRAGIESIDPGQAQAARSLGMTYIQTMIYVVLPPAVRRMAPSLVNELVLTIKDTSLGSVVGLNELLRRGTIVYQELFNPIETLLLIAAIYFVINFALSEVSRRLARDRALVTVNPVTKAVATPATQ